MADAQMVAECRIIRDARVRLISDEED